MDGDTGRLDGTGAAAYAGTRRDKGMRLGGATRRHAAARKLAGYSVARRCRDGGGICRPRGLYRPFGLCRPRGLLLAALLIAAALAASPPAAGPAFAQQDDSGDPVVVQPGNNVPDTVQTPAFAAFWQRFRAALRSNDKRQLQAMTQFPFDFDGRTYGAPDFAALAPRLYDAKTRHCLLSETPLHDQEMYEVFCGDTVYVFSPDPELPDAAASNPGAWRLIEIGAND